MRGALSVRSLRGDYDVLIGPELFKDLGPRLYGLGLSGRLALITDKNVEAQWGKHVRTSLKPHFEDVITKVLAPGEAHKSLRDAEALYTWFAEQRLTRRDAVVALGGGVIGDLAGFVAATFHRGVPLVHLPTSLLAQVDSSIGGKVAVDLPLGKNLVGAFHAPKVVIANTDALTTLPIRERWNGLAEVAKVALLADVELLELLEKQLEALADLKTSREQLQQVLRRAARIKTDIVSRDEFETGERTMLNFGHTLGHALEAATDYGPLLHGEAVVIGMRSDLSYSRALGGLTSKSFKRASDLLARFPAPKFPPPSRKALLDALLRDKKGPRVVLLGELGELRRAKLSQPLSEARINGLVAATIADLRGGKP